MTENIKKNKAIFIVGPTGVGKSRLAVDIAQQLNTEIISADSMQIYRHMDIGTAKVTEEEKKNIKHYMLDIVEPDEPFSVEDFQKQAFELIDKINQKNKVPIIVGGTGLYINSLVYKLEFTMAKADWNLRKELEKLAEEKGAEYLHEELKKVDSISADRIEVNNVKRVIRALEIYKTTGKPMSYFNKDFREKNNDMDIYMIALNDDREVLYNRINKRVDEMIEDGLIGEVKHILDEIGMDNQSLKAIGYKEVVGFLNGYYDYEEMVFKLKQNSRRYAKRQLSWFRRDDRINWYNLNEYKEYKDLLNQCLIDIKNNLGD